MALREVRARARALSGGGEATGSVEVGTASAIDVRPQGALRG